ncbi:type I restriction enzyme endonuclease domain-containing protein [Streptomyces sp. NPDC001571]|uniref:type I restriction enzyme endonuclease domain-containing protein n=1 Tax=Streptomyces sp. NPDC002506 TaxID=3154536 RepID=UPI00332869D0
MLSGFDIARALVTTVRRHPTADWVAPEPVRARLRSTIKRLPARHGYPPAEVFDAVELITKHLEYFARGWTRYVRGSDARCRFHG